MALARSLSKFLSVSPLAGELRSVVVTVRFAVFPSGPVSAVASATSIGVALVYVKAIAMASEEAAVCGEMVTT